MFGGFITLLQSNPPYYAAAVMTIIVSITLHELAHGFAAIKLGDDTPEYSGHMTWNPITHMGPFSIAAAFLAGIAWGSMPVDPTRLKGRYAEAIVAAAGPAVNLLLAILAFTSLGLWMRYGGPIGPADYRTENGHMVLEVVGRFNLLLCVFNLLPVPPLDGSKILANFNRPYAEWTGDPENQGITVMLFVISFLIAGYLLNPLMVVAGGYVGLLAG